jgi:hypothetical protein
MLFKRAPRSNVLRQKPMKKRGNSRKSPLDITAPSLMGWGRVKRACLFFDFVLFGGRSWLRGAPGAADVNLARPRRSEDNEVDAGEGWRTMTA